MRISDWSSDVCSSDLGIPVYGVSVRANKQAQQDNVWKLVQATVDFLKLPQGSVTREEVVANSDYVGKGYGIPTDSMIEAVRLLAQQEAILLDPVYSGKGMAGLIDLIRKRSEEHTSELQSLMRISYAV